MKYYNRFKNDAQLLSTFVYHIFITPPTEMAVVHYSLYGGLFLNLKMFVLSIAIPVLEVERLSP